MSTEFVDGLNRSWTVTLDFAAAKRVRGAVVTLNEDGEEVPFDLIDAGQIGVTMQSLRSRYQTLGETIYQIVKPQADQKGLTEEQFLDGCLGDSLDAAADAIETELINFFPKSLREVTKVMFRKNTELRNNALAQAMKDLEADTLGAMVPSGQSPIKPQESSESIQTDGHSES